MAYDFTTNLQAQRDAAQVAEAAALGNYLTLRSAVKLGTATKEERQAAQDALIEARRVLALFDCAVRQEARGAQGAIYGAEGQITTLLKAATDAYALQELFESAVANFATIRAQRDQSYRLGAACQKPFDDGSFGQRRLETELGAPQMQRAWHDLKHGLGFGDQPHRAKPPATFLAAHDESRVNYVERVMEHMATIESELS